MLISADQVSALLTGLGLTQSIFKPIPGLVGSLTAPLDGVVSTVDGIAHGLGLPGLTDLPLIGSILEAENPAASKNLYKSLFTINNQLLGASNSCVVEPYDPPPVLSQSFPPFDQAKANIFRYRQQQSVNLGSWFVHEQWMTESLFTCASGPQIAEIDIATGWGNTTGARAVLEKHWDTFINQSDFEYLASIGINTVRIPIGYWSLGPLYCQGTPFEPVADVYTNSWSRVVRAINWAGEAGIGVLIDLHGAVGSQNGQPHSGISDGQVNLFNNATNMDLTIGTLTYLAQQLASVTNVVGIEILNEPNDNPTLADFYTRAITTMRQTSTEAESLPLYIHDAFDLVHFADYIASRKDFVVADKHSYFVFGSNDTSMTAVQESHEVKHSVSEQLASASRTAHRNLVIGEWSCALVPASLANETNPMLARQQFCQGQEQIYSNLTAGWHFWSYMKDDCDSDLDWCFKNAVGNTLPSTFFSYNSTPATTPDESLFLSRAVADMDLPSMTEVLQQAGTQTSSTPLMPTASASDDTMANSSDADMAYNDFSKRKQSAQHQRFFAVHSRRSFLSDMSKHKRDTSSVVPLSLSDLTVTELSITKGYSDGFMTAKIFAQYGMSKLGFTGQYVSDSIAALGAKVVAPGTEEYYSSWFARGLADAESIIGAAVNN